jgi:hypothetical protein
VSSVKQWIGDWLVRKLGINPRTFRGVRQVAWWEGRFAGGCIDIDQRRVYSLCMEARR